MSRMAAPQACKHAQLDISKPVRHVVYARSLLNFTMNLWVKTNPPRSNQAETHQTGVSETYQICVFDISNMSLRHIEHESETYRI